MYKSLSLFTLAVAFITISGCASRTFEITPPIDQLISQGNNEKIDKVVGYYISAENKGAKVTSSAGGGETVSYFPYRDTELAFKTLLKKKFATVHVLSSLNDAEAHSKKNISYIFRSTITTNSSSESIMFWPPTSFNFELSCFATKPNGEEVWSKTVISEGKAESSESKHDYSLSARRASEKAFIQMLDEVMQTTVFN